MWAGVVLVQLIPKHPFKIKKYIYRELELNWHHFFSISAHDSSSYFLRNSYFNVDAWCRLIHSYVQNSSHLPEEHWELKYVGSCLTHTQNTKKTTTMLQNTKHIHKNTQRPGLYELCSSTRTDKVIMQSSHT